MIDVHFHCLPGLDDGPEDWDQAVALCRAAASEGTDVIVATPHVLRGPWLNDDPEAREALILELNTMLEGKPSVLPGCEYFLSSDAVEQVERGRWSPLTRLNGSRYLLVEFPSGEMVSGTETIFHELALLGITPVIAHPERSRLFAQEPERLEALLEYGAFVQVTAGSLLGDFGVGPQAASGEFLRRGLVHLIGSDAHSVGHRPPRLAAARACIRRDWGVDTEVGIFERNPGALLRSEPLPWVARRAASQEGPSS